MQGTAAVREYYDRKTFAFVTLGQGAQLGAIHRAVWGPGVGSRADAFHFVEDRIAELVHGLSTVSLSTVSPEPHVVDLGCGIGASLQYLAGRLPMRGTGVTLSPVQARLAAQRLAGAGLADRVSCIEGDYANLPPGVAAADLAFAIESFVHAADPVRFFDQCRRLVRPGGILVICDDVRRAAGDPSAERAIAAFRRGWQVNTLVDQGTLVAMAGNAGFSHEGTTDLTPFLELRRTRDRFIGAMLGLVGWMPVVRRRLGDLTGGHALQTCLAKGWIGYELLTFRRNAEG